MGEKFRIVIAEDYTIVRQGLKSLLDSFSDFEVVGEAVDGKEAIESVGRLKPDLVLMDLSMPKTNGITAIKEIKRCLPETRILALTVHKTEGHVRMALAVGGSAGDDCHPLPGRRRGRCGDGGNGQALNGCNGYRASQSLVGRARPDSFPRRKAR